MHQVSGHKDILEMRHGLTHLYHLLRKTRQRGGAHRHDAI